MFRLVRMRAVEIFETALADGCADHVSGRRLTEFPSSPASRRNPLAARGFAWTLRPRDAWMLGGSSPVIGKSSGVAGCAYDAPDLPSCRVWIEPPRFARRSSLATTEPSDPHRLSPVLPARSPQSVRQAT